MHDRLCIVRKYGKSKRSGKSDLLKVKTSRSAHASPFTPIAAKRRGGERGRQNRYAGAIRTFPTQSIEEKQRRIAKRETRSLSNLIERFCKLYIQKYEQKNGESPLKESICSSRRKDEEHEITFVLESRNR